MKINNILKVLFGTVVLAGFASCDDEVKYVPAEATPGVYFPAKNTSSVTLSQDDTSTSFDFVVARAGSLAVQSFTFTNNFPAGITMPAEVTFAEGEEIQTISVSYDAELLEPCKYNLEIGFAEGQQVSQVGLAVLKIAATMPEPTPVVAWKDLGECNYTDPFITSGFYNFPSTFKYKVKLQESGETAGLYRLVAPYGTAFADAYEAATGEELPEALYDSKNELFLEIDATDPEKVVIMPQWSGLTLDSDGEMIFMNKAGLYINNDVEVPAGAYGTLKDGILTLPAKTAEVVFPKSTDPDVKGYAFPANQSNVKMIVFPGVNAGDFTAEVEYMGQFNNVNSGVVSAVANITFGADVAAAKAAIVRSASGNGTANEIIAGTCADAIDVDLNDPVVSFPMIAGGTHTIVVVTYDDSGEAQEQASETFDVVFYGDEKAWNDLGDATFADGWIGAIFGLNPINNAYSVPAQESKDNPGLYRLKNPWGTRSPISVLNEATNYADLYIDARNPECILVMPQYSGFANYDDWAEEGEEEDTFGEIYVANYEGRMIDAGYTAAEIIAAGANITTFEDGLFTFNRPFLTATGTATNGGWVYIPNIISMILLPEPEEGDEGEEETPAAITPSNRMINAAALRPAAFHSTFKLARKSDNNSKGHRIKSLNSKSDFQMK